MPKTAPPVPGRYTVVSGRTDLELQNALNTVTHQGDSKIPKLIAVEPRSGQRPSRVIVVLEDEALK